MSNADALLEQLEKAPISRWQTQARIIVGSATFFDAFDALSLAFALPVLINAWHITPRETGLLISSSYAGQFIGALIFSTIAEKFGRIRGAASATALMSIMSVGCALSRNFPELFAFRFIQGIGVGGEMPVAAAYISELSKAHGRGRFFLLYELIFPIGLMATGQIGAWVVPAFGWQSIFWIAGIPGLVITVLILTLPESPRWLISKADMKERGLKPSATLSAREILGNAYRPRTLIVWTLWATTYFVANSLNNWLPSLYNTVYHLELRQSLRAASLTNVMQVAVLLVCVFTIDRIGRRNWAVAALLAGGATLLLLTLVGGSNVRSVIALTTLSYGIVGSVNAVLYLYTPEIYPTRMRALGTGLATGWLRLASATGPIIVGALVTKKGTSGVFLMFSVVAIIGAIAATRMIETRARRLEEIAN